jgi:hypothetical protein
MQRLTFASILIIASINSSLATPVNPKAIENLHKNFPSAINEIWSQTKEGTRVKFESDNQIIYQDYTRKGKWISTITVLPINNIPENVRETVEHDFKHYDIFFAQHVQTLKGEVYIIKIKTTGNWKTLKTFGGQYEVIEDCIEK